MPLSLLGCKVCEAYWKSLMKKKGGKEKNISAPLFSIYPRMNLVWAPLIIYYLQNLKLETSAVFKEIKLRNENVFKFELEELFQSLITRTLNFPESQSRCWFSPKRVNEILIKAKIDKTIFSLTRLLCTIAFVLKKECSLIFWYLIWNWRKSFVKIHY